MRSFYLISAVVCSYLFLRGHPVDWHPVLRICLSGVTLVLGIISWGRGTLFKSQSATSERPPSWLDYLSLGAAILALKALFLFFFATAPEKLNALATQLDEKLHPSSYHSSATEDSSEDGSGDSQTSGNWLWQNNGQRTLGTRGKVRPSNRPEVFLWPSEGREFETLQNNLYLRSFTLARYESGTWKARPIPTIGMEAENNLIQLIPPAKNDLRYEITHEANTSGQSLLVGIPNLTSASVSALRLIAPATYRLPALKEEEKLHRYQASSRPLFFDPNTDLPAPAETGELTIPENLREPLELFATNLGGPQPEQLARIRSLLNQRCQYSLKTNFDPEAELISQFLFTERRGYCEHFATAAALLARTIGYPSRVAYGWSGGRYYTGSNMYVFRAKEAHAWTEVKIAGKGWVIFEATPANRSEGNSSLADHTEKPPSPGGAGMPSLPEISLGDQELSLNREPLDLLRLFSGIIATVGSAFLIVLLILKRKKKTETTNALGNHFLPPAANYLTAFRKASATLGIPMPIGRTLRAHLEAIESLQPIPFAEELLSYHYGHHYSGKNRDKPRERRLLKEIKRWGAQSTATEKSLGKSLHSASS
ncbi:MAG: transglutaminase-like domain-containing protein [Akkermansiaceae bacterium]